MSAPQQPGRLKRLRERAKRNFITGLLVIVPLWLTWVVLAAIVRFVLPGASRAVRLAAREIFIGFPAEDYAPSPAETARGPRARPEDAAALARLSQLHAELNRRYFDGALGEIPLVVMDTAPAAVLGATFDPLVQARPRVLIANVGNFHTLAFRLGPGGIEGVFEHHTGLLDLPKLSRASLYSLKLDMAEGAANRAALKELLRRGVEIHMRDIEDLQAEGARENPPS